jgi:hypothetical protein
MMKTHRELRAETARQVYIGCGVIVVMMLIAMMLVAAL